MSSVFSPSHHRLVPRQDPGQGRGGGPVWLSSIPLHFLFFSSSHIFPFSHGPQEARRPSGTVLHPRRPGECGMVAWRKEALTGADGKANFILLFFAAPRFSTFHVVDGGGQDVVDVFQSVKSRPRLANNRCPGLHVTRLETGRELLVIVFLWFSRLDFSPGFLAWISHLVLGCPVETGCIYYVSLDRFLSHGVWTYVLSCLY